MPEDYSAEEGERFLEALGVGYRIGSQIDGAPAENFMDNCPPEHREEAINILRGLVKLQDEEHPQFENYRGLLRKKFDRYVDSPQEPGG